jgi:hypothetical protein
VCVLVSIYMTSSMRFWRSNSNSFILLVCTIKMEFFKAIHMSFFLGYLYYFHCVLYVPGVPCLVFVVRKWVSLYILFVSCS